MSSGSAPIASAAGFGQGGHGHAVGVGPWRSADQLLLQRMRPVGQFQQGDVGDDAEAAFHQRQAAAHQETGQRAPDEMADRIEGDEPPYLLSQQASPHRHEQIGHAGAEADLDQAAAGANARAATGPPSPVRPSGPANGAGCRPGPRSWPATGVNDSSRANGGL